MAAKYESLTDEQIIELARDGDHAATDYLMEKYKGLVRSKAKSMYILGGETDDLIQEGMMGLFKAVRDYDSGRDASFMTFAQLCISRQLYTAVQASGRKKHLPLNTAISLYTDTLPESESGTDREVSIMDTIAASDSDPEEQFILTESLALLEERIDKGLSPLEKQVLDLYLTGMNYVEIAHVLGREEKSTDNALQRIRTKIRKMISE
ncbi:MAG: sigma-70 family RNA polymerase sigma factor [Lachnospiraceae bacterium]|nr:sigma-70 family RNA polymerase sigma factor [Lachnospiraceae bacterium]